MSLHDRISAFALKPSAARRAMPGATEEQRWAFRKTGLFAAFIVSDRLQGTVGCLVRDMSATGARIVLQADRNSLIASAAGLPNTFKLILDYYQIEVDCEIAWRSDRALGVRFLSNMKQLPKKPRKIMPKKKP